MPVTMSTITHDSGSTTNAMSTRSAPMWIQRSSVSSSARSCGSRPRSCTQATSARMNDTPTVPQAITLMIGLP